MTSPIADKTALVILIEGNDSLRSGLSSAIKSLGFAKVQAFSECRHLFEYLEAGEKIPDWIVTSLQTDGAVNALHMLDAIIRTPELHKCRVSLMLENDEGFCVRNAFELGLLSWHFKAGSAEQFKVEFAKLMKALAQAESNDCAVAADYLRKFLETENAQEEISELDRAMLLQFPGSSAVVLKYGESLFKAGKDKQALLCLSHAKSINPEIAAEADRLIDKFSATKNEDELGMRFADKYEIHSVVVVDSDESVRNHLEEILTDLGVMTVKSFADGLSAWEYLSKEPSPGLIIQEWKLPQLSGAALLQRVRAHGILTVPVIIYSSVVSPKDRLLLREVGVSDVMAKPLTKAVLSKTLTAVIEQEFNSVELTTLERKIRQELAAKNFSNAKQYLEVFGRHKHSTESARLILKAELLYYEGSYVEAKSAAVEALTTAGESLPLLNLLGKILLKLKEFDLAQKFFAKATSMSPNNIERLCALAETELQLGNVESAGKVVNDALKVDPSNKMTVEAQAKVAVTAGDTNTARDLISKLSSTKDLVAYINNKAVSLAYENRFSESMELYNKALKSLPSGQNDLTAVIRYNMGLGYAKQGDKNKADELLGIATSFEESPVFRKAKSLRKKVVTAIDKGTKLELNVSPSAKTIDAQGEHTSAEYFSVDDDVLPKAHSSKAGKLCCHLVYHNPLGLNQIVHGLLANKPRYLERVAKRLSEDKN